ncbi:MAG: PAS domain S-box protein [Denitromonas halophila]|nr:MAG: PAS domain S-box protein [Denitromonas halophila]TVT74470.1 MAG: PAS domain S-box protein [Denitromonas halophila]TVT75197.1 MAG: PAS domain S-box protein [Denitromonas halophila]
MQIMPWGLHDGVVSSCIQPLARQVHVNTPADIPSEIASAAPRKGGRMTALVAVAVVALALASWGGMRARVLESARQQFALDADAVVATAEARLARFAEVQRGAAGLVRVAATVPTSDWEAYVDALRLTRAFPGFSSVSLGWRIPQGRHDQLDPWVSGAVGEYFDIRPAGERPVYLPVVRVAPAPMDLSRVLGFDLLSDPARRVAAEHAWRSGDVALSAHTAVRGDTGEGAPAFSLVMPVYATAAPPLDEAQREAVAMGVISADFFAAEFLESVLIGRGRLLAVQLYDSRDTELAERLAVRGVDEPSARFGAERQLHFGGHAWFFRLSSTPAYEALIPWWQAYVVAAGVAALGALVVVLVGMLGATRRRADRLAKRMTAALREKDQRLRLALEGAQEGWWDWDPARGGMLASDRALKILGVVERHPASQLLAVWRSRLHPQDRAAVDAAIAQHLDFDAPLDMRYRIVLPDGLTRWLRTRGKARRDATGAVLGVAGFIADITAEQLAAEAQTRLAARHASALAALPDLLFEFDEDCRYVGYHASDEGDLAMAPADFMGKRSADVLPPAVAAALDEACRKVAAHGGVEHVEYTLNTLSGEAQSFEGRVVRVETGGFLCIVRNLSEFRRVEQELTRHRDNLADLVAEQTIDLLLAKDAADRASRGKSEFLATLSHELRTPLHAILGFAEMGLSRDLSEARRTHCLQRIELSGQRLLGMVSDLLDVARTESAHGKLALAPVDWAMVCRDVVDECEALAQAKGMRLHLELAEHRCPVRADGLRLQQVVMNLVTNAIKFSPVGTPVVLRLGVRDGVSLPADPMHGEVMELEVIDQGIGLPEDGAERLFEAFVRGHPELPDSPPGSGLGLSICRQFVEAFGGRIAAANRDGGGAVFRVQLPCAQVGVVTGVKA